MTNKEICGILSRNLSRDNYTKGSKGIDSCVSIIMGKSGIKDPEKQRRIEAVINANSSMDYYDCGVSGDMEEIAEEINKILSE